MKQHIENLIRHIGDAGIALVHVPGTEEATAALEKALAEALVVQEGTDEFDWDVDELTNLANGLGGAAEGDSVPPCVRAALYRAEEAVRDWVEETEHTAECGSAKGATYCYDAPSMNAADDNDGHDASEVS